MAYTSRTELENAISAQTVLDLVNDDAASEHDEDTLERLASVITQAGREIDGYCQAHYAVPFTGTIPPLVANLALTIALFYLYRRRRNAFQMPEDVEKDYDRALKKLGHINNGKLDLGLEPPPASSSKVVAQSAGPDQFMTHDTLKDM